MIKKTLVALFLVFGLQTVHSQQLDSYQFVVIPAEFDFQKGTNQYQLNELLKFLFEKEGLEAFLDNEPLPSPFSSNSCKGLRASVKNESGLFRSRLYIELKDCNNMEVFVSREGVSRLKDYEAAYQEALRAAFESISELNYNVDQQEKGVEVAAVAQVPEEKEVAGEVEKELPQERKAPKELQNEKVMKADSNTSDGLSFLKDGSEFFLEKTASGYNLYQKGMAEPFASLIKSSAGNSFIYSSVTAKGMAHVDKNGDLTVEILDPNTNELRTTVYRKQD